MRQDSTGTNRHGIPLLGGSPTRCCWPDCPNAADRALSLPVCRSHALKAYAALIAAQAIEQDERGAREAEQAQRDAEERKRERLQHQVIYYVETNGHIKIGWTSDFDKRMRAYPPNSRLLALHPGTHTEEQDLHRRFKVHRTHGAEWYPLATVILEHIERMRKEHGEPPSVIFGARPVRVPRPIQARPFAASKHPGSYRL